METTALQRVAEKNQPEFLRLHPIIPELRERFEADYETALARHAATPTHAVAQALHRARERLQLVSGEHAPLDEELHTEHKALEPVAEGIAEAISAILEYEAQLAERGQLPWYRRRADAPGYWKRRQGPVAAGAGLAGEWVPGHEDTGMATRADEIWFRRAGADPLVALTIMKSIMASVQPPPVKKNRGQYEDEQIDHVVALMKHKEVKPIVSTQQIRRLLVALGYPPAKVTVAILDQRAKKLRDRGVQIAVAKTNRGKTLGRPRA